MKAYFFILGWLLLVPICLGQSVVINEIYYDDPSGDDYSYVELFGPGDMALDGYSVVLNNQTCTEYLTLALDGFTIPSDGFFVIGMTGVADVDYVVDGDPVPEPTAVNIVVTDFCTGDVVAGASVYVNGSLVGTTNSAGSVYAGMLNPGQTYTLRVTASGYTDSDNDILNNDSFTVPET